MADLRQFNLIVGGTGSGKSTFCANIIKQYKQNVIVLKHLVNIDDKAFNFLSYKNYDNWRQGAPVGSAIKCKFSYTEKKTDYPIFLKWVKNNFRNGAIFIDDATILERDRLSEDMQALATMRRHYGIDIYLIYHGLTLLPIDQFIHVDYLIMFNTGDNVSYKAQKLPCFAHLQKAKEMTRKNFLSTDKKYIPICLNIRKLQ